MRLFFAIALLLFLTKTSFSKDIDDIFFIGKMESYNKSFTLYFKTRKKAILARGEDFNYINDYPQDLYIYDHKTKIDSPLISYDWFPSKAKRILK